AGRLVGGAGGGLLDARQAPGDGLVDLLGGVAPQLDAQLPDPAAQGPADQLRQHGADHRGRLADGLVQAFGQQAGDLAVGAVDRRQLAHRSSCPERGWGARGRTPPPTLAQKKGRWNEKAEGGRRPARLASPPSRPSSYSSNSARLAVKPWMKFCR